MNHYVKECLAIFIASMIIVPMAIGALYLYTGILKPLSVVESKSMQHSDDRSYIGIIDTGDMIIVRSPDKKPIITYIEGISKKYSKFGSYGDVIIYNREGKNPVIHRAILWLNYDDVSKKWSAPALKDCEVNWRSDGGYDDLKGVLKIDGLPGFNLDHLKGHEHSGYLTKGDNNNYFDQDLICSDYGIHPGTVQNSELKAIADIEIPWIGCLKLLVSNKNIDQIPSNSITSLIAVFTGVCVLFALVSKRS